MRIGRHVLLTSNDREVIALSGALPGGFRAIFTRHYPAVLGYLRRRVEPQVAEDLAMDTFLLAFRLGGSVRRWAPGRPPVAPGNRHQPVEEPPPVRASAARRLCQDGRRPPQSNRSQTDLELESADGRADAARAGPELAQVLRSLRPESRDALLLFAWGDLTYEQIATALHVPVGTVRSRISRARRRVREHLAALENPLVGTDEGDDHAH